VPGTPRYKQGQRFGSWTLVQFINAGSNGEVWTAEAGDPPAGALKVLHRFSGDGYERFRREVDIVRALDPKSIAVLPLLDASVPLRPSRGNPPWYVMPLATGITDALSKASVAEKVEAVRQIADTLATLVAEHELNHRDVKPENLYQHRGRFVIGDFGLAKRPGDEDLTGGRAIGPLRHLPSEVFVGGGDVDWEKVDVHCLANSLWQLISGLRQPPRGPILVDGEYGLARAETGEHHIRQLDLLIAGATSEAPASRPTLAQFAQQLREWLNARETGDALLLEDERMRRNRALLLRWLVAHVREEPEFRRLGWEVQELSAPSGVGDLTDGEVSEAFADLAERYLIDATPHRAFGRDGPFRWTRIYPTSYGIEQVEDPEVLLAQAAPLLRALAEQRPDYISLPPSGAPIEIGTVKIRPPEAYFLFSFLSDQGLVEFDDRREGARDPLLMNIRVTATGRDWLVSHYAGQTPAND
jgi:serine/threonine protein kinase